MGMINRIPWPLMTLALCAAVHATPAQAETDQAGPRPAEPERRASKETALEEIVVTAEKRESTVQKTPISMTALSEAEIEARGFSDFRSIAQETPGVSMKTSGPGQTEFEMRGLTATGGFSPTVGFYVDDAPLTAPSQAAQGKVVVDPDLYDLNRVEVLRGPQGTLYGSGSMGGTIKLVTNPPELNTVAVSAQTKESGTDGGGFNYGGSAMLNLPIAPDVAAVRFVGTYKYTSGWIDRVVLSPFPLETNGGLTRGNVLAAPVEARHSDVNWEELQGGRVSVLFKLGDRLSITPGVMYQKIHTGGAFTIDDPPGTQYAHYQPFDIAEPLEDNFSLYTLTLKYHFDFADLTSATAKWNRHDEQTQDISETMQALFGFPSFYIGSGGVGAGSQEETDFTDQASEEIRLASNGEGPFQWLGGLFYSHFVSNTTSLSLYPGFASMFGTDNLISVGEPIEITQRALFGEASYRVTDQLKATLGLRYYRYTSSEETINSGLASIAAGPGTVLEFGSANNKGFNPKVNLAYTPLEDLLVYGTAAKGFRPGGPNSPVPLSGPVQCLTGPGNLESLGLSSAPNQFNPDNVWSYEIGEKARTIGNHLQINSDVYYERWTDVQQLVDPSCGFGFTANAGTANVYGSEIELAANLTPSWTLTQNVGYTHATFADTVRATNTVAGQKLLDVPDATANTSLIYSTPLSSTYNFNARGTYTYVGPMQDITYVRNNLPGYSLVNVRAGIGADRFSAYLFCDNLTNKLAILTNNVAQTVNIPSLNRWVSNQPRTIGLDLQLRY
ncbi:MAG TPA: TonB-dependent receptor [Steroidobacteraceae bacterium]|nr:TonB-dependent receptor [Steroidobacteraceae bacterium]